MRITPRFASTILVRDYHREAFRQALSSNGLAQQAIAPHSAEGVLYTVIPTENRRGTLGTVGALLSRGIPVTITPWALPEPKLDQKQGLSAVQWAHTYLTGLRPESVA